ncbi:MAG: YraN family protein [Gammaproteobacteria bacterium]
MEAKQPTTKKQAGNQAEALALHYLQRQGFELIECNFQCKTGEIDLIMKNGETLVFVEVRYRKETQLGSPLETITRAKQRKLYRAAQFYLQQRCGNRWPPCRFDVIGISGELDNFPKIEWVSNAF